MSRRRDLFTRSDELAPEPQNNYVSFDSFREMSTYPADGTGYAKPAAPAAAVAPPAEEVRPMVFRSRANKDIYVYEYPDRFEYYLRTYSGITLIKTINK